MLKKLLKGVDRISDVFAWLAAPMPFIASIMVVYEIIMRTVFHRPTVWAFELTAFMCGACYFLGGAWNVKNGTHVRVDFIYVLFPLRGQAVLDILNYIFQVLYIGVMIRVIWPYVVQAVKLNESSWTFWNPLIWPMKIIMLIGFVLVFMQLTAQFIRNVHLTIKGRAL